MRKRQELSPQNLFWIKVSVILIVTLIVRLAFCGQCEIEKIQLGNRAVLIYTKDGGLVHRWLTEQEWSYVTSNIDGAMNIALENVQGSDCGGPNSSPKAWTRKYYDVTRKDYVGDKKRARNKRDINL